ncbi:MAG: divalent-cation tolerance protein CutA [Ktedonobacteraceae bacterium]|nr:divalent-cation tolerance protein CutA [Ktedonobacteraceae bacterium]
MTDFILVLTAIGSQEEAQRLASAVVGKRFASSTNILGPARSTYWWKGRMETAREEWFCLIRTTRDRYEAVEQTIRANHSYEEPGIIALPIIAGSESYLNWMMREIYADTQRRSEGK